MRSTAFALCLGATLALAAAPPAPRLLPPGIDDASIAAAAVASFPEFFELLSLPNDLRYSRRHPEERRLAGGGIPEARVHDAPPSRTRAARSSSPSTARARAGRKTVLFYIHFDGQPVVPSQWAQKDPFQPVVKRRGADGKWAEVDRAELDEAGLRPGAARLRALLLRRQGPDRDVPRGFRPPPRKEDRPRGEREGSPRQRGGGQLARYRRCRRRQCRAPRGRCRRPRRRPRSRVGPPEHRLRQSRHRHGHAHRLRAARPAPQRALRQLGAQSRGAPRASPRHDEGRGRPRDRGRVLRAHEPHGRRPKGPRGGPGRRGRTEEAGRHRAAREGGRHVPGGAPVSVAQRAGPRRRRASERSPRTSFRATPSPRSTSARPSSPTRRTSSIS